MTSGHGWLLLGIFALFVSGCGDEESVDAGGRGGGRGDERVSVRVVGLVERADGAWRVCLDGDGPCWPVDAGGRSLDEGPATLTGTWDGASLVLTAAPEAREGDTTFPNPCPDVQPMSGTNGDDDVLSAVQEYVSSIPEDFAGSWLARPGPVFVVAVIDDVDRHRAALASRVDRGVCVTSDGFRWSEVDLRKVQREISEQAERWRATGYGMTFSSVDVVGNVVEVGFDRIDAALRDDISDRWGERVTPRGVIEVLEAEIADLPEREVGSDEIRIETSDLGSAHMDALGRFVLRYDADSDCVYFEADGERVKPVFPYGWRALRDPVRVLDGRGVVLAQVDQEFEVGGGNGRAPSSDDPLACGAMKTWIM